MAEVSVRSSSLLSTMFWVIAVLVLVLIVALHLFFPREYHGFRFNRLINQIPGPRGIPYFGNTFEFFAKEDQFLPNLMKYVKQYPILKISFLGIPVVCMTDMKDIEVVISSRQHITKGRSYDYLKPWLGTGLLTSSGKKWAERRKTITPAFHFGTLEQYVEIFTKNGNKLVRKLMSCRDQGCVNINELMSLCTLDIICETAMGIEINALDGGGKDYVDAITRMGIIYHKRLLSPWFFKDWMFNLSPTAFEQRKILKVMHNFSEKVIQERTAKYFSEKNQTAAVREKKRTSFLDLLIEISQTEKMTFQDIREEVDTFMFEGHDTTATAFCWALFELGLNHDIQERCYQELCDIFGDSDRNPTMEDVKEMRYLERVIKETLRLYPPVPIVARVTEVDFKIGDYTIPRGVEIPFFIYAIHRNPKIYPDPERFDPDRFLPEVTAGRHPYAYVPFSAGPRNCIGQKFAMTEEKIVISQILRKLHITTLEKRENVKMHAEMTLKPKDKLKMVFRPRKAEY